MVAFACAPSRPQVAALQAFRRSSRWIACSIKVNTSATSERSGNRMFVFGLGYVGRYLSEQLKLEGWLRTLSILHDATHILISIPPVPGAEDPILCLHEDLQPLLSCGNLQWLGYLSSTSVYGDCDGGWVDEDCPVNPKMESAKLRLEAEKGWMHLGRELGFPVNVFRLGGIYGPGRSALDTIMKNTYLSEKQKARESKFYTSRVHVADIYQSIRASFNVPSSGRIYNVVDDDPAPRAEVFSFARGLVRKKWPGLITESGEAAHIVSPEDRSPGEKRVSNARIKNELGVKLVYPSYRSGLENILSSFDQ